MKQKIVFLFALLLLTLQGWATPVDSLSIISSVKSIHMNQDDLSQTTSSSSTLNPFTPPGPTDFQVRVDETIDFGEIPVGTSQYKIFLFKTYSNDPNFIINPFYNDSHSTKMWWIAKCIVDTVVEKHTYNTNPNYPYLGEWKTDYYYEFTWAIKVIYSPTSSGTHDIILCLKKMEKYGEISNHNYKLTGSAVTPTITSDPSSWDFGMVVKNKTAKKTFTIKGTNLTGDLTLEPEPNNSFYSVYPRTITAEDAANGAPVTVTYNPTVVGVHKATLTIQGGGAKKNVKLTGECVSQAITVSPSTYNYGTVYLGNQVSHNFTLTGTNLSKPIYLTEQTETSGGEHEYFIYPTELPAEGGTVTVIYKPLRTGNSSSEFTFSTGEVSAKINVTGKCDKCPTINVTPSTYDFGTVKEGSTNTATFTVTGTNLSERISLIWPQEDGFTISPVDLPASGGKVTVTFKPTSGGNYSQQYTLSSGNTSAKITVTGKCAAATTNKSALYFGSARKGETKTQTFKITGVNLTHDLTLTSSNSSVFVVSPSTITAAQAKAGKEVTVTYKPNAYVDHSGTITISGQDIKSKSVRLSGKCANIAISPASYDFGTCTKGKAYTKTFTVTGTNVGERISVVTQYEEEFSVTPTDLPAAGGTVTVTFKPSSTGSSYSYTFYVSGGGITTPVSVTGKSGTPSYDTDPSSLTFVCYSSKTFTVKGSYLTGSLSLYATGDCFTVTPTTITASEAAAGKTVTVKCTANVTQPSCTGKIIITGGAAPSKTVKLFYNPGGNAPVQISLVEPEGEGEDGNDGFLNVSLQEAFGGPTTDVNELAIASKVYAEGLNIIIETPIEQKALISDIAGHVREVNLQTGRNEIPVNANGVFIVRIREKTTKLMLK